MAFIRNSDKLVEGLSNRFFTNLRAKQAVQGDLDSLLSAIQLEEAARQSEDNGIKGRLDVLEGTGIGSVKKAEQDAKAYADSLDAAMSLRVAVLESDPVTKSYVDSQVSNLQGQITLEISNRQEAVSSEQSRAQAAEGMLSGRLDVIEGMGEGSISKAKQDAKDYADQKVADLVNSAPAVLDTLKELADAINNDQNFAATVAGEIGELSDRIDQEVYDRQMAISDEEAARQGADNALSGRISILESDPTTKTYVDGQVSGINTRLISLEADPTTKTYVDGKVTMLEGSIAQEASERQSAVEGEASARQLADTALSGRLDVIEGSGIGSVAKALVDAKAYADGIVASEQSARESADSLLDGRLDVLETDPVTKSYVDGQYQSVFDFADGLNTQMDIRMVQEVSDREAGDTALDAKIGSLESLGGKTDELWTNNMQTFMNVLQNDVVVYVPHNSSQAAHLMSRVGGSTFKMTVAFQGQELEFGPYALRGTPYLNNIFLGENVTIPLENITAPTLIFQEILNGFGVTFDPEIGVAGYNFVLVRFDTYANTPADLASGLVYERNVRTASDNQIQSSIQALKTTDTYVLGDLTSLWGEIDYIYGSDGVVQGLSQEVSNRQAADSALSLRLDALEADPTTKTYVDGQVSGLQGQIDTEKGRIDAILSAADADKDSFAEIVQLINSIDTSNDSAFASYVLSNDAALAQEVSDRQAGDSALSGRLDALESDPTTKSYVDSKVSLLQAEDETFFKLDGSRPMTGGMRVKHVEKSANYTLTGSDYIVGVTSVAGGKVMTLPSAATMGAGKMFVIKDQSGGASVTNYIRIACQSGEQIDGLSSYDLDAPYESVTVVSNGTHWFIM